MVSYSPLGLLQGVSSLFRWHKCKMDTVEGESHNAVVDGILEPDRPIPSALFGLCGRGQTLNKYLSHPWMNGFMPLKVRISGIYFYHGHSDPVKKVSVIFCFEPAQSLFLSYWVRLSQE